MKFENNKNLKSQNIFNLLLFSFKKEKLMSYLNVKQKEGGWIKMNKFYGLNQKILKV